jgi:hypothetical protein
MGILLCREVTSLGDSFGFDTQLVKKVNYRATQATRKFIVEVEADSYADTETVLAALPQKGTVHPTILDCIVDNVVCTVTSDVHIYEATVNYKWAMAESDDIDRDLSLPWKQPAALSFSSDTSMTRAMDMAYGYLGWQYLNVLTPTVIQDLGLSGTGMATGALGTGTEANVPLVIKPLNEQPMNLPEEPVGGIAITLTASIKGEDEVHPEKHVFTQVKDLVALSYSMYAVKEAPTVFDINGYEIKRYNGYISSVNIEDLWYYSKVNNRNYAYYKITITILDNPETWIRSVLNLSYNYLDAAPPAAGKLTKIRVKDGKSTTEELIEKPIFIDCETGAPLAVNTTTGLPQEAMNREAAVLYLTKRINDWAALKTFIDELIWTAPPVGSAIV